MTTSKPLSTAEKFLKGFLEDKQSKLFFKDEREKAKKASHNVDWLINNPEFNKKVRDEGVRDFAVAMATAGLFEPAHLRGVLKAADKFDSEIGLFTSIMKLRDIISMERKREREKKSREKIDKLLEKLGR